MGRFLVLRKLLLVRVWFLVRVLSRVFSIFCITSFGDGTRPLHQSIANNGLMLSIMVETMCWFSTSSRIWPFDFSLPWYCPHLPTPIITDRRQNLFPWMKSQSVGKIWRTVNQWTTNFFSVNFYIFKKYWIRLFMLWTILQIDWSVICLNLNTVEPPCTTTSRKRPPPITDRQSKTPKFSQSKPYSWNLS